MKKTQEIQFIEIRYEFTQDELNAIGPLIARLSQDIQEKEDEKKVVMADYKHQIASIRKEFDENVVRLNNRFEMRNVQCRVVKNYRAGEFEFYDMDSFSLVKTEPFNLKDYQRDFDDYADVEPKPYGPVTDPVPTDNGTLEENPKQFESLLRELNYWREELRKLPESETQDADQQIELGLEISNKIKALEEALKAMAPPTPPAEDVATASASAEAPTDEAKSEDATGQAEPSDDPNPENNE